MPYQIYTDGASRGNPGPSGIGAVIFDAKGKVVHEIAEYIGEVTNNVAEYQALIAALDYCVKHKLSPVEILADSQLLIKQLAGEYRVKHENIIPLYRKVQGLLSHLEVAGYKHVYREDNKHADRLANRGIDEHQPKI
ncbi:MAG TPA: ribonuclease HI family protein [bacterium]|nr:ribonuclease HI family protein [bacterium]